MPSLLGTTAVVTGGELRHRLPHRRWSSPGTAPPSRSPCARLEKGEAAAARIREAAADAGYGWPGSTSARWTSVREFAEAWQGPLGLLVNNAGLMSPPRYQQTAGRVRAAVRHQPPRPLRADRPAASRAARRPRPAGGDRLLDRAPQRPPRRARRQPGGALQPVHDLRQLQAGEPAVRLRAAAARLAGRRRADLDRRPPGRRRRRTWSPASRASAPIPGRAAARAAGAAGCSSSRPRRVPSRPCTPRPPPSPAPTPVRRALRETRGRVGPARLSAAAHATRRSPRSSGTSAST